MKKLITLFIVLLVSSAYAENSYQVKLYDSFNNKFISIEDGANKYCFKGANSKLKIINNISKCTSIDSIYLTNKGSICIETENIFCKLVDVSVDGKYYWGKDRLSFINIYSNLDGLTSGGNFLKKEKILKAFSNKYIAIENGSSTLCFKQKNNKTKVVKNIGNCKSIKKVYVSDKSHKLCIHSSFLECKNVYAKIGGYSWGGGDTIRVYSKLSNLDNTPIVNSTNQIDSVVKNKHIASGEDGGDISDDSYWGKKYYAKAKKYFKKKDYSNAYKWAKKSADKDYKGGYYGLGLAFLKGYGVESIDKEQAIKWFRKAAEKGHTRAQFRLGHLLMYDNGSEAEKWYTKAADKGHLTSQNNLGYMYQKGMGSSMWGDSKLAYKYYLMAAKQGSGIAQYNVCVFHFKGKGGAVKSNKIAEKWCQKAVDGGYGKAHSLLEKTKSW